MTKFIEITNKNIYDKLESIEKRLIKVEKHVIETNGKVKLNRWISGTALSLTIALILVFIKIGGL